MKYSVLLPTYNERTNLPLVVAMMIQTFEERIHESFEIIIVDDNSPDGTGQIALDLQKVFGKERIIVIQRPGKLGLGSAYRDGLEQVTGDFVFLMDGDLSHHPKDMHKFIAKQKEKDFDIVTGSRYIPTGGVCGWDLRRKLTSRVANYLASTLLHPRVSDLTGSFRLYRRSVIKDIMQKIQSTGYVFQMEIIVRARGEGYSIAEVPIIFVDRIYGESKLGADEIVKYLKGMLWLFFTT